MNVLDVRLLGWLQAQINTGAVLIEVPAILLEGTTREGLAEARRIAQLAGCRLLVRG